MRDAGDLEVRCPRCGYDQRGIIATWRESCPLEATCTECGLVFSCAETLRPEKFEPRWCVEYCIGRASAFLRACAGTLGRSFLPWRFWSRIRMSHRIRPKRLVLYVLILLAPILFVYVTAQSAAALYARSSSQLDLARGVQWLANWTATAQFHYDARPDLLEELKEREPDRWEKLVEQHRARFEAARAANVRMVADPPYLEHPPVLHVLEAVFLPLATESRLSIAFPSNATSQPYTAPIELWLVVASDLGIATGGGWWGVGSPWSEVVVHALAAFAFGAMLALLFPVSLALLPLSRRKAKVRWAHIARITAYGLYIPAVVAYSMALLIAVDLLQVWRAGSTGGLDWIVMVIAIGGIPLGTLLWWTFAINRHLRMPHALAVAATLLFTCFLVILAAIYLLAPHWIFGRHV